MDVEEIICVASTLMIVAILNKRQVKITMYLLTGKKVSLFYRNELEGYLWVAGKKVLYFPLLTFFPDKVGHNFLFRKENIFS